MNCVLKIISKNPCKRCDRKCKKNKKLFNRSQNAFCSKGKRIKNVWKNKRLEIKTKSPCFYKNTYARTVNVNVLFLLRMCDFFLKRTSHTLKQSKNIAFPLKNTKLFYRFLFQHSILTFLHNNH